MAYFGITLVLILIYLINLAFKPIKEAVQAKTPAVQRMKVRK